MLNILVIDDQIARSPQERSRFLAQTEACEGNAMQLHNNGSRSDDTACVWFSTGQRDVDGVRLNDLDIVLAAVQGTLPNGADEWNLVLIDARFDAGRIGAHGVVEGAPSDAFFGEHVFRLLCDRFPGLPIVMFTSKSQRELEGENGPYVSKRQFRTRELRATLLQHGRLGLAAYRSLLHVGSETVVASRTMCQLYQQAEMYAESRMDITIVGEAGSGRTMLARYVHARSPRRASPFVPVNLAAIPAGMVDMHLFGKPPAIARAEGIRRGGYLQEADSGTIFFSELGDLPLDLQARLLQRLKSVSDALAGDPRASGIDVRVLASTQRPVEAWLRSGMLRHELWARLSAVVLTVPPLRDHPEDILPLFNAFLEQALRESGKIGITLSHTGVEALRAYNYPGNVAELSFLVRRLVGEAGTESVISSDMVVAALQRKSRSNRDSTSESVMSSGASSVSIARTGTPAEQLLALRESELVLILRTLQHERTANHPELAWSRTLASLRPERKHPSEKMLDDWLESLWGELPPGTRHGVIRMFPEFGATFLGDPAPHNHEREAF